MDKDDGLTVDSAFHLVLCLWSFKGDGWTPNIYAQHPEKQESHCETLTSIIKFMRFARESPCW